MLRRDFQCYDAKDGSLKWKTSYKDRHNYNPTFMILADGKLILQHLQGLVEVIKPSPESYQSLGTYDLNGKKPEHFADSAWQTPALSRGRLYCRMNFGDVVALDVRADRPAPPAPSPILDGYVQKLPRADQNMAGPVASEDRQGGLDEEIRVARVQSNEKNALVPPFQKPEPSDYFQGRGPNRDGIVPGSEGCRWIGGKANPGSCGGWTSAWATARRSSWATVFTSRVGTMMRPGPGPHGVVSTAVAITSLAAWMCVRAAPSGSVPTCPRRLAGSWMWIVRDIHGSPAWDRGALRPWRAIGCTPLTRPERRSAWTPRAERWCGGRT